MRKIDRLLGTALAAAVFGMAAGGPASALSMKECSAKFQAARKDGTLAGLDWKTYRAKQCSAGTSAASAAGTSTTPAANASLSTPASPAATTSRPTAAAAVASASGPAIFPRAADAKYSKDTAGKARMETCLDQYRANKANNGNGGLRWIQKGGGYYSECTKKLKG